MNRIYAQLKKGKTKTNPPIVGTKKNPVYYLGEATVKGNTLKFREMSLVPIFYRHFKNKLLYMYVENESTQVIFTARMVGLSFALGEISTVLSNGIQSQA